MKLAQHTSEGLATVEGGVRKTARTLKELMAALDAGLEQRAVAETGLNAASSRSHLLVSLVLKSSNRRSGRVVRGKLTLVDLAGSERVEKSGVAGDELKEAMSINKSLSAIGDVISALSTNQKHVPCRGPSDERCSLVLRERTPGAETRPSRRTPRESSTTVVARERSRRRGQPRPRNIRAAAAAEPPQADSYLVNSPLERARALARSSSPRD